MKHVYFNPSHLFSGTGLISANGGAGACVPGCAKCDSYRRCLQCAGGYTWDAYVCKDSYITQEVQLHNTQYKLISYNAFHC